MNVKISFNPSDLSLTICDTKLLTKQTNTMAPTPPPEHRSPLKDIPALISRFIEDAILITVSEATIFDFVTMF